MMYCGFALCKVSCLKCEDGQEEGERERGERGGGEANEESALTHSTTILQ